MAKGIWVFAEVKDGNIRKITFELLSQGRKMAGKTGDELIAVLLGSGVEQLTDRLAEYADKVFWVDDPALAQYTTDAYATVLTNLLKEHQPSIFLCGSTVTGKDLSPRIAARLQTGLATDCTGISIGEDGAMIARRPVYAGKAFIDVTYPAGRPQMASVRPNVLEMIQPEAGKKGTVTKVEAKLDPGSLQDRGLGSGEVSRGQGGPDRGGDHRFGRPGHEGPGELQDPGRAGRHH